MKPAVRAFTLVELSIVLVILGLLVGGVLSGQALIRAAELRAITVEKDKYVTALNAFKDKYLALPGDMANAHDFWGDDCGDNDAALSTGCNGDGDGVIENYIGDEGTKAWRHLSLAGLIEGTYNASGDVVGDYSVFLAATNSPASKVSGGYWTIGKELCEGCNTSALSIGIGSFSADMEAGWIYPLQGVTNTEAWSLDRKIDDGYAERGKMRGNTAQGNCSDTWLSATDPYGIQQYAEAAGQCVLQFVLN